MGFIKTLMQLIHVRLDCGFVYVGFLVDGGVTTTLTLTECSPNIRHEKPLSYRRVSFFFQKPGGLLPSFPSPNNGRKFLEDKSVDCGRGGSIKVPI